MRTKVEWKGGRLLEGTGSTGEVMTMDISPEQGGTSRGVSPMEALLCAVGACTAVDVLSILEKKRQKVTAYEIEIDGERPPAGEWPRPFTKVTVRHHLQGENLDPGAVERAIALSDEKYCSVAATLRQGCSIESEWSIAEPVA
ncbi:MAG: OsmC family protein [Armatimonadetes bacterium]|nr:OsmC family protein [Armatimonadota bacterium]